MKFKVGDKVLIRSDCPYLEYAFNPENTVGTIDKLYSTTIFVHWSNGMRNMYLEEHLEFAPEQEFDNYIQNLLDED